MLKYSEYENLINEIIQNVDDIGKIELLKTQLKEDLTRYNTTTEQFESTQNKIKELQETNMKLYLNLSKGTVEKENTTEETKSEKDIFNELFNKNVYKEEK